MNEMTSSEKKADQGNNSEKPKLTAIILAAGKGTRMKSPLPKVLHPVAGRPMIERVIRSVKDAGATEIRVVIGHGQNLLKQVVSPLGAICFLQAEQKGTGDAVKSADLETIEGDILILNGDHPLISAQNLIDSVRAFRSQKLDLAVVTCELEEPGNYGRIVRHMNRLKAIVEAKDASAETKKIKEINTGIYITTSVILKKFITQISSENSQNEYYLTDLVSLAVDHGKKVDGLVGSSNLAVGVNSQKELAVATKMLQIKKIEQLMDDGVIVIDPSSTYVEDAVQVGQGSVLYPNCFLRGTTRLGSFCVVEPNAMISDSIIGNSVQIRAGSYLEQVQVGSHCLIGPYARLRPQTQLDESCHIGNFVELKKVKFGKGSKANHLTYLGDADIGSEVNIGCGTITCNYAVDRKKYQTKIGDRVFVGSDTQFIAPVSIGNDVIIGSGSTITKSVPDGALAVTRSPQIIKEGYANRLRKKTASSEENKEES